MKKLLLIALLIVGAFANEEQSSNVKFNSITGEIIKSDSYSIKKLKEANQKKLLRLKNNSTEYIIYPGDPILIKRKSGFIANKSGNKYEYTNKGHLGGKFINIEENYLLIDTSIGKKNKTEKVFINNIHSIYIGNTKSYSALYKKWSIYFAILLAPGSIQMANSGYSMFSKEFTAIVNWSFFNMLAAVTYTPLFSYIDFNIKKSSARKFLINLNHWEIIID